MNYRCIRTERDVDKIMERIKTEDAAHEIYITKSRKWISQHDIGSIVSGKVIFKQLELVFRDSEGFTGLFTVSLDTGFTSVVRGRLKHLTAETF